MSKCTVFIPWVRDSLVECAALCNGQESRGCTSYSLENQVDCNLGSRLGWEFSPLVSGSKEVHIAAQEREIAGEITCKVTP